MHHTKEKGDIGLLKAQADLADQGFKILHPLSEHMPFDLVAYKDGVFIRVQVKYRSAGNGIISVDMRSVWADKKGNHRKPMDKDQVDVVCVYCPNTGACYYINPKNHGGCAKLRISPAKNNQKTGILLADEFRKAPVV